MVRISSLIAIRCMECRVREHDVAMSTPTGPIVSHGRADVAPPPARACGAHRVRAGRSGSRRAVRQALRQTQHAVVFLLGPVGLPLRVVEIPPAPGGVRCPCPEYGRSHPGKSRRSSMPAGSPAIRCARGSRDRRSVPNARRLTKSLDHGESGEDPARRRCPAGVSSPRLQVLLACSAVSRSHQFPPAPGFVENEN